MSRPARSRKSTLVERQTKVERQTNAQVSNAQQPPWTKPWWYVSQGNGSVLFYIVMIHALALAGIILFTLPSWRVLVAAVALAYPGGIGTSGCYHRCLTHSSLRCKPVVDQPLI